MSAEAIERWLEAREAIRAQRVRLGLAGYVYLAAMLRDQPCTVRALQARARLGHVAAYRFVMTLYRLGRAHIAGWQETPRAPLLPIFAWGPGADVPAPKLRSSGRPVEAVNLPKLRLCAAVIAFDHLLRTMEVPCSRVEIAAETGLDDTTVQNALEALLETGMAHLPLWLAREQGGDPLPQYQAGPGRNAPKPKPRRAEARELRRVRDERRRMFAPLAGALGACHAGGTA